MAIMDTIITEGVWETTGTRGIQGIGRQQQGGSRGRGDSRKREGEIFEMHDTKRPKLAI